MNKKLLAAPAVALAAVLALVPTPAYAYDRNVSGVGYLSGYYSPGGINYSGAVQSGGSWCVKIQRKAAGVWRDNVTVGNTSSNRWCDNRSAGGWTIIRDDLALNTEGIRLVNMTTGTGFNLCSSRDTCRAM